MEVDVYFKVFEANYRRGAWPRKYRDEEGLEAPRRFPYTGLPSAYVPWPVGEVKQCPDCKGWFERGRWHNCQGKVVIDKKEKRWEPVKCPDCGTTYSADKVHNCALCPTCRRWHDPNKYHQCLPRTREKKEEVRDKFFDHLFKFSLRAKEDGAPQLEMLCFYCNAPAKFRAVVKGEAKRFSCEAHRPLLDGWVREHNRSITKKKKGGR